MELILSVSGVSSGKRFVAQNGLKVRRTESMATALGLGVGGVRPVVEGGGMVANRQRGDDGVSVSVCVNTLVVTMDGPLTDLVSVGRR